MKILKSLLVFGTLLLSTQVQANDYALLNTYPLLNDMKMVKKEQQVLQSIKAMIDAGSQNHEGLKKKNAQVSFLIRGLKQGDKKFGLKGTELKRIRTQLQHIEILWNDKQALFSAALNSTIYKEQAYESIDELTQQFNKLYGFYNQSYTRYKQNTVMKSLVQSYARAYLKPNPHYALNTIKQTK